jgi:hypothetical protein
MIPYLARILKMPVRLVCWPFMAWLKTIAHLWSEAEEASDWLEKGLYGMIGFLLSPTGLMIALTVWAAMRWGDIAVVMTAPLGFSLFFTVGIGVKGEEILSWSWMF